MLFLDENGKMILCNISNGETVASNSSLFSGRNLSNVIKLNGGYAVVYSEVKMVSTEPAPALLILLDKNLKVQKQINISETLDVFGMNVGSVSVTPDGGKVVCFADSKFIVYDIASGESFDIFKLNDNTKGEICSVSNVSVSGDGKYIAFSGDEYVAHKSSIPVLGVMDIDGRNIKHYTHKDIDNALQLTNGFAFFDEGNFPLGQSSNGKAFSIDFKSKSLKEYTFQEKNESQKAVITPDGKTIVTMVQKSDGFVYRAYLASTMKVLKEWRAEENAEYYQHFVSPDGKNVIVWYYTSTSNYFLSYSI
jgi:WD40 repeat protein